MNNKWNIIADGLHYGAKTFLHNDGHFCVAIRQASFETVYHFIVKDMSRYGELNDLLESRLGGFSYEAFPTFDLNQVFDDEFYELVDNYTDDPEPEMRTKDEIAEYELEAFDRVWLVRKQNMFCNIAEGKEKMPPKDILEGCMSNIKRVCETYEIDFEEPVSDWEYGYWSGILAALRWVLGCEKDFLDT